MTPWIRQSLTIDRNVLEEGGTVLVIPAIFRSGERSRKRDNEKKDVERGDNRWQNRRSLRGRVQLGGGIES